MVYTLTVDAATSTQECNGDLGAILCQTDAKGESRVISNTSREFSDSEKNYGPFLLEMQAACWMDHFCTFLRGQKFILFTDHKPFEKPCTVHTKPLTRINE
jgi:hypothetical protein